MATVVPGQRVRFSQEPGIGQQIAQIAQAFKRRKDNKLVENLTEEYLNQDIPDLEGFASAAVGKLPIERTTALMNVFLPKYERAMTAQRGEALRGSLVDAFGLNLPEDITNPTDLMSIANAQLSRQELTRRLGAQAEQGRLDREFQAADREDRQAEQRARDEASRNFDALQAENERNAAALEAEREHQRKIAELIQQGNIEEAHILLRGGITAEEGRKDRESREGISAADRASREGIADADRDAALIRLQTQLDVNVSEGALDRDASWQQLQTKIEADAKAAIANKEHDKALLALEQAFTSSEAQNARDFTLSQQTRQFAQELELAIRREDYGDAQRVANEAFASLEADRQRAHDASEGAAGRTSREGIAAADRTASFERQRIQIDADIAAAQTANEWATVERKAGELFAAAQNAEQRAHAAALQDKALKSQFDIALANRDARAALQKAQQIFEASEAQLGRDFQMSERTRTFKHELEKALKANNFARSERLASQAFASLQADRDRAFASSERVAGEEFRAGESAKQRTFEASESELTRIYGRAQGELNRANDVEIARMRIDADGNKLSEKAEDVKSYGSQFGIGFDTKEERDVARNLWNAKDEIRDQVDSEFTSTGIAGKIAFLEGKDAQARNMVLVLAERMYIEDLRAGRQTSPAQAAAAASAAFENGAILPESVSNSEVGTRNFLIERYKFTDSMATSYIEYLKAGN